MEGAAAEMQMQVWSSRVKCETRCVPASEPLCVFAVACNVGCCTHTVLKVPDYSVTQ